MTIGRLLTILLTTVATIAGLAAFFLFVIAAFGIGNPVRALAFAAVFVICLWYVMRVMRADRAERRAEEAGLPPERRPVRRQPRQPITFQLRETLVAFVIWGVIAAGIGMATGLQGPVLIPISIFAGFMLATITVTGRHMMFRLTGDEDPE